MDVNKFALYFDHTALKPETTINAIEKLCKEAATYSFAAVCINPFWLKNVDDCLKKYDAGGTVKMCTVVNFPLGASGSSSAVQETEQALKDGAQEIDCVINIGALKSRLTTQVKTELRDLVAATRGQALLKVIVESGILTQEELKIAIDLVNESGAEYIKTSTGFASTGATVEAVKMMKQFGRPDLKIKASGGIKTLQEALTYIDLGVSRIGASLSVNMVEDFKRNT